MTVTAVPEVVVRMPSARAIDKHLAKTFELICKHACDILRVDHSGFVRFDDQRQTGTVVAQYPNLPGLTGRTVKLRGVPAEEEFLRSSEPLVIEDVADSDDLGEVS